MVSDERLRIGLLATDPLRLVGLQAIFGEAAGKNEAGTESRIEVVPLTVPGAVEVTGLALAMIDADCTEHLFELLGTFRRKHPRLKLIVMGQEGDPAYIQRVIGAGAKGYLTHSAREAEIRMAVDIVLDGSVWAPRKVLAKLLESNAAAKAEAGAQAALKITDRERQVLRLLVAGSPNRQIASSLGIDAVTVKAHVGRLMRKVGVDNRIELSLRAVSRNLLSGGS